MLYDGLQHLLLRPYLGWVHRTTHTPGATAARFVFGDALPRIFIDPCRDSPTHRLALGTGQTLNIAMTLVGAVLLLRSRLRRLGRLAPRRLAVTGGAPAVDTPASPLQQAALASVLAFCLTIPSNWTQDVPARYGKRHPGLSHSRLYPPLDTSVSKSG